MYRRIVSIFLMLLLFIPSISSSFVSEVVGARVGSTNVVTWTFSWSSITSPSLNYTFSPDHVGSIQFVGDTLYFSSGVQVYKRNPDTTWSQISSFAVSEVLDGIHSYLVNHSGDLYLIWNDQSGASAHQYIYKYDTSTSSWSTWEDPATRGYASGYTIKGLVEDTSKTWMWWVVNDGTNVDAWRFTTAKSMVANIDSLIPSASGGSVDSISPIGIGEGKAFYGCNEGNKPAGSPVYVINIDFPGAIEYQFNSPIDLNGSNESIIGHWRKGFDEFSGKTYMAVHDVGVYRRDSAGNWTLITPPSTGVRGLITFDSTKIGLVVNTETKLYGYLGTVFKDLNYPGNTPVDMVIHDGKLYVLDVNGTSTTIYIGTPVPE